VLVPFIKGDYRGFFALTTENKGDLVTITIGQEECSGVG
jgi:hypothetical protein